MANRFLIDYTFFVAYKNFTLYPTPSSKKSYITVSLVPSISETIYQGEYSVLISVGLGLIVGIILALTDAGGGLLAVPLLVFGVGLRVSEAGQSVFWP